jgi:hypothetical protein
MNEAAVFVNEPMQDIDTTPGCSRRLGQYVVLGLDASLYIKGTTFPKVPPQWADVTLIPANKVPRMNSYQLGNADRSVFGTFRVCVGGSGGLIRERHRTVGMALNTKVSCSKLS